MTERPIHVLELRSVRGTGGGPEKTILRGAQRADPARFRVTVCYLRDARDAQFAIGARADCQGVDYVELVERRSFDPRLWSLLRRLVRDRAIDIVHAHDYKTDLLALMLARVDGIIQVATAHGWTGHSRRERWLYYPSDKRVLRAFPITIAVSGEIRSELVRAGLRPEAVRVILNGIDHRAFVRDRSREASARRSLGLGSPAVIGSAGRLEPQKRFDLLIEACTRLRTRYPELRLLIAGEGSLREELAALGARLLPAGSFALLGQQPDIRPLHHAIDVFVQSSDYEGTSNAVLEAMALETPVVATSAGGTTEIVDAAVHGLIVPTGDAAALAEAIDHTLAHRAETAARVARARRRTETTLSFESRMAAVERLYAEAFATRGRGPSVGVADRCA